ncbi:uncharacterized protein LOC117294957 [Asterias rubens]|uniref:uncharacterized protein LOC117294957 n=1 Tax=Asterias rubens TaxID=7604 RepID=UPI00145582EF|nr:uncharacterized protein LOC117294957 [Asterias rubens]
MAFPSRVIRTYGRHKKRTIAANVWISPENETKSQQHVFSSPELCDFSIDLNTDSHSSALTNSNSNDDKNKSIFEISSDDEWIPLKRDARQTKKALKGRPGNNEQPRTKSTRAGLSRKVATGKENLVNSKETVRDLPPTAGDSKETVRDLPPTAGGRKFTKLSRKGRGKNGSKNKGDVETTEVKPENQKLTNLLTRFDLIHSPIERSSQSLSKRGRTDTLDCIFDTSCDLFGYSADDTNCSGKDRVTRTTSEESVFDSPMTSLCTGKKGSVETSTPIGLYVNPSIPHQLNECSVIQSGKPVTRSSIAKNGNSHARIGRVSHHKANCRCGTCKLKYEDNSHARIGRVSHHKANCRCGTCKLKYADTLDLFDLSHEISLLDLNNSCAKDVKLDTPHQLTEGTHINGKNLQLQQIISPCSVIVTPLSDACLSQYSNSSVSSYKSVQSDIKDNKDEDDDRVPDTSSCISVSSDDEDIQEVDEERNGGMRDVTSSLVAQEQEPVDEDIEDVDQEKRNGWMRDVTSSLVAQELEPVDNDRIQDVCSESRMESNGYKLAHSFKEVLTPVKSRSTGCLITAREKILQQCNQEAPISFNQCITTAMMKSCLKIGEGVYGEVYRTINAKNKKVALKIIPIEGDFEVNSEPQKSFEEILPEIVISRELSGLQERGINSTGGFIQVNSVSCVQGSYPDRLLTLWDEYKARKASENDRPDVFGDGQLFIVFEFADGGADLESKTLETIHQAVSILQQVASSLAVAEQALEFEHRDLHWGNILILPTSKKTIRFHLNGDEIKIEAHGVQVGMIDFTLSRLRKDDCTVYCDLSSDETLFTGRGDLQFEVYRRMKDENDNDWEPYNPHTNVLWLHYLVDKLLNSKAYSRAKSDPTQRSLMRELRSLGRHLLGFMSTEDVIKESELLELGQR